MMVLEHDFVGLIEIESPAEAVDLPLDEDGDFRVTLVRLAATPPRSEGPFGDNAGWEDCSEPAWLASPLQLHDESDDSSVVTADLESLAADLGRQWRLLVARARRHA